MKTVLLLGAGVTRAARPSGPLKNRPPLDRDFFEIASRSSKSQTKRVVECLEELVGDYADVLTGSLETSTTYLYLKAIDSSKGSIYHESFLRLLSLLGRVLASTTNGLRTGPRSLIYRFLRNEIRKVERPEDLTIVTFNYDLLLERTLNEIDRGSEQELFLFPGCYRLEDVSRVHFVRSGSRFSKNEYDHRGVSILKLHGSMNWFSRHAAEDPTPSALFNPRRRMYVLNSPEIRTRLTWQRGTKPFHMKPIIVPPISGKRGMFQKNLPAIWRQAGEALASADRVVIAGYSCPPLDLEARILISENMRANSHKRIYVVDPATEIASRFVELCGVDHVTIYSSIKDWVRDAVY